MPRVEPANPQLTELELRVAAALDPALQACVMPAVQNLMPQLLPLRCDFEFAPAPGVVPCLRVTGGENRDEAQDVLACMAEDAVAFDTTQTLTLTAARALFGLPAAARSAQPSTPVLQRLRVSQPLRLAVGAVLLVAMVLPLLVQQP